MMRKRTMLRTVKDDDKSLCGVQVFISDISELLAKKIKKIKTKCPGLDHNDAFIIFIGWLGF